MTFEEAIKTLRSGSEWADLGEAIGVVASDPQSSLLDLLLGLKYGGIVAEQAILALYGRTHIPIPEDRSQLISTASHWVEIIAERYGSAHEGASHRRNAEGGFRERIAQQLIENLSSQERLVLVLYYYEQMTLREIAATMHLTEAQVSEIHRDVLDGLRALLASDATPLSHLLGDVAA